MTSTTTTAVINLDLPQSKISRHIYGHFAEHLGRCIYGGFWVGEDSDIPNERGIRLDVVEALRAISIPNLRWPGGCFADEYHWKDGIGPRDQRPRMVNSHWGDVVEDNSFGTHEFMDLCELLGTDPYISGNIGSGTVFEMSEWIEYLTRADDSPMADLRRRNGRDEPWKVPFWGLGNEAWGCGGNMRIEVFAGLARQYATYVRNHAGNDVYRIAAGANVDDYHWTEVLMQSFDDLAANDYAPTPFQALSLHYYTRPSEADWHNKGAATGFPLDEWYSTHLHAARIEELVSRHAAVMERWDPKGKIGLVVDEWGTWYDVEPGTNPGFLYQQNTMRDALVASVHFDAFHRHADRVVMANIAQTVNVLQAMILTDPDSGALVLTPSYHVFQMNVGHQDADALDVTLRNVPTREVADRTLDLVSASASVKGDSALVSLSNIDDAAERTIVLDLRGRGVISATGTVLTGDALDAHNTPENPDAVRPTALAVDLVDGIATLTVPAHAYATVSLTLA